MIVCAGQNETIKGATPIGVGLIQSAINLTKLCIKKRPKELIFVGSAGSYGRIPLFESVTAFEAYSVDISYLDDLAYTPLKELIPANVSCETNIKVNSSNYITTSKLHAKKFLDIGLDLENMEFFSVVSVAKSFGLSVKGEFVVTNYCDENAHKEFMTHHAKAKKMMEDIVARYV